MPKLTEKEWAKIEAIVEEEGRPESIYQEIFLAGKRAAEAGVPQLIEADECLPCPFCGSDAYVDYLEDCYDSKWVVCSDCGANTSEVGILSKKAAVDRWNTRTAPTMVNGPTMPTFEQIINAIHAQGSAATRSETLVGGDHWHASTTFDGDNALIGFVRFLWKRA